MLNQLKEKYSQKFAASLQELKQRLSPIVNLSSPSLPSNMEDQTKEGTGEFIKVASVNQLPE